MRNHVPPIEDSCVHCRRPLSQRASKHYSDKLYQYPCGARAHVYCVSLPSTAEMNQLIVQRGAA